MTSLDAPLRNVTEKLLKRFGTEIVLRSVESGGYDTTRRTTATRTVDKVVKGMPFKVKAGQTEGRRTGSRGYLVAALGLDDSWPLVREPKPSDRVVIGYVNRGTADLPVIEGGVEYRVVDHETQMSGDLACFFELYVSR